MGLSASKNERGMTIIEVLVSLVIVFIIFLGISAAGIVSLNANIRNELRDEAVSVADGELQEARRAAFDNLVTLSPDNVVRRIRSVDRPFTVTRAVSNLDADNRQVTILVAWTRVEDGQTKSYTHQVSTIVRRP